MSCPLNILLVGCGSMGSALHNKWKDHPSYHLSVIDPSVSWAYSTHAALPKDYTPSYIIFAVKPQSLATIANQYQHFISDKCIFVSIAAGFSLSKLKNLLSSEALIIRTMPNLPAKVGQGLTALITHSSLTSGQIIQVESLFQTVGKTIWVKEEYELDIITALSGSGPAYFYYLAEALIKAGISQGLSLETSTYITEQTLIGAAALLHSSSVSCKSLRQLVTSPQGTTEAALTVLTQHDFETIVSKAVQSAVLTAKKISNS